MDTMLAGLSFTVGYLDDILVGGRSEEEHQNNLRLTLQRLNEYGFTVRIEKCTFGMKQVRYLGQILDGCGIRPDPEKISTIVNMPPPHDVSTLRSYLGAVNYYGKYVKEMRALRHPMDQLLKAGEKFEWSAACQASFDKFREVLQSPLLLTHYNPKMEIVVSADASTYGLGARIAHQFPDGTIKAICHVSRNLTPAERNYSQIEKEGLALVFAVTRFHRMLFGRRFTIETDHKPLLSIFGAKKGIPTYTANRLQRWALTLLLYDFDIRYVSTESFGHADILSRLINRHVRPEEDIVIAALEMENTIRNVIEESLEILPVTFKRIQTETKADNKLQRIMQFVSSGWPKDKAELSDAHVQQFYRRRESLTAAEGCLMYADRLVVPSKLRNQVLRQLHNGHPGIERMRSIARQYVYWPHIDDDIAKLVRNCIECSSVAKTNPKVNLESWPNPEKPWQRLHLDYAGPFDGWYYLILVDAFSKWPEVIKSRDITTAATLRMLRDIFARFGSPETLVTDNGTQFCSSTFEAYCERNAIVHLRTAPFHPQSNGLAERFVDTFKRSLKKITAGGEALDEAIATFLQCYRSTPCRVAPNGNSPAEVLLGRRIRTSHELMRPPSHYHKAKDSRQEEQFNRKHGTKARSYAAKDLIWAKVHRNNSWSWEAGTVIERLGAVLYNVWLPRRQSLIRSHCNQLRARYDANESSEAVQPQSRMQVPLSILLEESGIASSRSAEVDGAVPPTVSEQPTHHPLDNAQEQLRARHSTRNRRMPARYEPYQLF